METHDTVGEKEIASAGSESGVRVSIDRFEMNRQWLERTEEEQVEAAAALYEKAARQRMPACVPDGPESMDSEELEALSQELKLRQKCQDIAAQIMVDELEDSVDDEEEE